MMRSLWIALLLAVAATPLALGAPLEQPPLRPGESLSGRFVQERHLAGLSAPLVSEGRFLLAAGKGLVWHTEKPFDTTIVITPAGLLQLVDGREVQRMPAASAPFVARLYTMLGGALGGDWSAMAQDFSVERRSGEAGWTILLKPLAADDLAAAPLQSIAITGSAFVDSVEIRRPNGDWDHLAFSDEARSSAPLAAADARLLESDAP
jgi:hypothetical protein